MQINFTGGAAIIVLIFMWGLGGLWIWIHIFGGGFSYETEGLIPKLRRFRKIKASPLAEGHRDDRNT